MTGKQARINPPELLDEHHDLASFQCGEASLDDWLKRRARANQVSGASRTYVVASERRVIGYYCLASGAIAAVEAPGRIKRNMPDPIPVAIMGRLAIDREWQGAGIGKALLQDAVLRTAQAAAIVGIRGLLVHALSEKARIFYEHHGFVASPSNPMTLIFSIRGISV